MKKWIICFMLILAGGVFAQSKTSNVGAEEQKTRQELAIAKQVIGEQKIETAKLEITVEEQKNFIAQVRKVLDELVDAKTIEERDEIVKKYQLKPEETDGD